MSEKDPGFHYRREYRGIKLDPARIAKIYNLQSPMLFTVLKKILRAGNGGYKDYHQDLLDCKNAIDRELEIIEEDLDLTDKEAGKTTLPKDAISIDLASKWGQ